MDRAVPSFVTSFNKTTSQLQQPLTNCLRNALFYPNDGRLPGVTNLLGLKQRTKLLVDVQGTGTLSRWNTLKADKRGAAALKAAIRLKMKSPLAFLACVWVTQSNLSCSSHRKVKLSVLLPCLTCYCILLSNVNYMRYWCYSQFLATYGKLY